MTGRVDLYMLEKQVGKKAADKLKVAFKTAIANSVTISDTGEAKKATVTTKYKNERLDRLSFVAPHYIFKQNFGFEGDKKNVVNMRLTATDVLNKALNTSNVLEELADDLTNIRAEEVLTAINFTRNGGII